MNQREQFEAEMLKLLGPNTTPTQNAIYSVAWEVWSVAWQAAQSQPPASPDEPTPETISNVHEVMQSEEYFDASDDKRVLMIYRAMKETT